VRTELLKLSPVTLKFGVWLGMMGWLVWAAVVFRAGCVQDGGAVSASNPLSERCPAKAKSTGEQCRKWVVGTGVCPEHGGNARQVRAAREARIVAMSAELEAAKKGQPFERRHPGEVLMTAVLASDVLLTHLLDKRAAGELTAEESTALGWAIDRAARTSKTALDANIAERLTEIRERPTRMLVDQLVAVLRSVSADPRVTVEPGHRSVIILDAVRRLGDVGERSEPEVLALPSGPDGAAA
jgi:hypothetical protein